MFVAINYSIFNRWVQTIDHVKAITTLVGWWNTFRRSDQRYRLQFGYRYLYFVNAIQTRPRRLLYRSTNEEERASRGESWEEDRELWRSQGTLHSQKIASLIWIYEFSDAMVQDWWSNSTSNMSRTWLFPAPDQLAESTTKNRTLTDYYQTVSSILIVT